MVYTVGREGDADLTGDGYITGTELGMYLSDRVVNYTHRRQRPQYGKINNPDLDRGDFIFVLTGKFEAKPPGGAVTAEAGFPAIGTRYTYKIDTEKRTYTRSSMVIEDGTFEGKLVHRSVIEGKYRINIYDKASKNWVGQIVHGKVRMLAKPHEDLYRFSLYVGKKYISKYFLSKKTGVVILRDLLRLNHSKRWRSRLELLKHSRLMW